MMDLIHHKELSQKAHWRQTFLLKDKEENLANFQTQQ